MIVNLVPHVKLAGLAPHVKIANYAHPAKLAGLVPHVMIAINVSINTDKTTQQ
jgi:hypothetical protein